MLVSSLNKLSNLNMMLSYSDAIMAGNDLTSILNEQSFTIEELKEILKIVHANNKVFILKLNGLLHEDKIELYKSFITNFNEADLYYTQDLGVVEILTSFGHKDKIIYDPVTMICNSLDAKIYNEIAPIIGISCEIKLSDANIIANKVGNDAFYKVFGYHQMCFSKRKLISLYLEENKINKQGDTYYLKEEKREDFYPVIERDYGTIILRSYAINLMKEFHNVAAKYKFIETILLSSEQIEKVLCIYSRLIKNEIDYNEALASFAELGISTSFGFTYQDSIYLKEEMKNV